MKRAAYILFVLIMLFGLSFTAFCVDTQEDIKEKFEESFFSGLDEDVYRLLEDFGLESFDADDIFSKGSENIKAYFSETLTEKLKGASGWFFTVISVILLLSVVSGAFEFSLSSDAFSIFTSAAICVITVGKISTFLNCVLSSMELNGKLMIAFIPVYALLISLSGNPASALTYNSFLLFFCQLMSFFLDNIFVGVVGAYFALSIAFSFNPTINLNRFINGANRITSLVLGTSATMFTGLLSLKNVIAVSTDSLSVKGVRYLLSSLVPVIGSSLSEAYSSVLGSINLMKGSVAVLGVFVLVLINIPALSEGVIYFFLMTLLSCLAEILGLYRVSEILRSFASCVRLLLLVCLFQVFILIISIGLMSTLRGG